MILLKTVHPNRWFLYFIAIAFIILLGVYYAAQTYLIEEDTRYLDQPVGLTDTPPAPTAGDSVDTSGWKTYRNEEYGFEFKYPIKWVFSEVVWPSKDGVALFFSENLDNAKRRGLTVLVQPARPDFYGRSTTEIMKALEKEDIDGVFELLRFREIGGHDSISVAVKGYGRYAVAVYGFNKKYDYVIINRVINAESINFERDKVLEDFLFDDILSTFAFFEPKK